MARSIPDGDPPRLLPDRPLPPYSYLSGRSPHPIRDPAGHLFGHTASAEPLEPEHWRNCRDYLHALDLFNHGYYWEAHEAWEGLWHAVGRRGAQADFLKGLIKLAAAGVKARERRPAGTARHAKRAAELFAGAARELAVPEGEPDRRYLGLSLDELIALAKRIASDPPALAEREPPPPVEVVFDFRLLPA